MGTATKELKRWLDTLPANSEVGIDEGGLTLCLVGHSRKVYLEVGGLPDEEEEETPTEATYLHFEIGGKWYAVNELGQISRDDLKSSFSPTWIFLGVSKHHWSNHVTVPFSKNLKARDLVGGLVWDIDHGTTRQWGGRYMGKLRRITSAYFSDRRED